MLFYDTMLQEFIFVCFKCYRFNATMLVCIPVLCLYKTFKSCVSVFFAFTAVALNKFRILAARNICIIQSTFPLTITRTFSFYTYKPASNSINAFINFKNRTLEKNKKESHQPKLKINSFKNRSSKKPLISLFLYRIMF